MSLLRGKGETPVPGQSTIISKMLDGQSEALRGSLEVSREGSASALLEPLERSHGDSIMEPRSRLQIKLEQERIAKVTGEHHTNGAIDQGSYFRQIPGIFDFAAYYDDSSLSCCSPTLM